jgi:prepilin-type processing-associated H-X9-DG protein
VGEKFLSPEHYFDGEENGDNETLFTGYCTDNHRFTRVDLVPISDGQSWMANQVHRRFGSAHATSLNFVYCDGSVRSVSYDVEPIVHFRSGHTADGGVLLLD